MAAADDLPTGTLTYFRQTSAPTSWTKSSTYDDAFIRIVTGAASSGGSSGVTSVFTSGVVPSGTAAVNTPGTSTDTALSDLMLASHLHTWQGTMTTAGSVNRTALPTSPGQALIPSSATLNNAPTTAGATYNPAVPTAWPATAATHNHPLTIPSAPLSASSLSFAVRYVDLILAEKTGAQQTGVVNFPASTIGIFAQTNAPTGWTKDTTNNNDSTLRLTAGTVATGGTVAASTCWTTQNWSATTSPIAPGSLGNTTLASNQMPFHYHGMSSNSGGGVAAPSAPPAGGIYVANSTASASSSVVGGAAHGHSYTVNSVSWTAGSRSFAVKYVDSIVATKD